MKKKYFDICESGHNRRLIYVNLIALCISSIIIFGCSYSSSYIEDDSITIETLQSAENVAGIVLTHKERKEVLEKVKSNNSDVVL